MEMAFQTRVKAQASMKNLGKDEHRKEIIIARVCER